MALFFEPTIAEPALTVFFLEAEAL